MSLFTSSYAFAKLSTFFFGFGFFGDPVLWRIMAFLDRRFKHWKQLLELQKYVRSSKAHEYLLMYTQFTSPGNPNECPTRPHPTTYRRSKHRTSPSTTKLTVQAILFQANLKRPR